MTTVGYGDLSATGSPIEQIYVCIMIFFGMAVFALIQNRIQNLKEPTNFSQMIEQKSLEMQYYLADIDRILPGEKINKDIYQKCFDFMRQSFKYSVYNVYHTYPFFKQMPPRLKEKLFKACMTHELKQMAYFFHDKISN